MSEARELYYTEINKPWHKTRRAQIENYVSELEQQKAEFLEYLKYLYTSQLIKSQRMTDILNKYK